METLFILLAIVVVLALTPERKQRRDLRKE